MKGPIRSGWCAETYRPELPFLVGKVRFSIYDVGVHKGPQNCSWPARQLGTKRTPNDGHVRCPATF